MALREFPSCVVALGTPVILITRRVGEWQLQITAVALAHGRDLAFGT